MIYYFLAFIGIALVGAKISLRSDAYFEDYLSVPKTTSVKGIFILLVFFSHFNKYVTYTGTLDLLYFRIVGSIGQIMVVSFLFYSGYGVMESISKKGAPYVSAMPKNRILKVLLEFDIAVAILMLVKYLTGDVFTLPQILLTLIGWESDWFVFAILCLYIFTYLSFKLLKDKKPVVNVALVTVLTIGYILTTRLVKDEFYYNTVLCYPLGMFWSLYKDKIAAILRGGLWRYALALAVFGAAYLGIRLWGNHEFIKIVGYCCVLVLITIGTMRVSLHNKILYWCGKHLFEIYILHRIPMILCEKTGLIAWNVYLSFAVCLAATMLMSWGFHIGYRWLWEQLHRFATRKVTS